MGRIKELGKDKWALITEAGKTPATGKRKRIYQTFYGKKRAAEKELAKLEASIADGTFLQPAGMTVEEYLLWWLEQYAKSKNLALKTIQSYTFLINRYLIPSFGAIPLEQLHPMHIQGYVTKMNNELSPRTVTYSIVILRLALKHAVQKWRLIKENPAAVVDVPGNGEPRRNALNAAQMQEFLDRCCGHKDYPIICTVFYTGMRRGEILGLQWNEVNLEEGSLEVKWTMQRITGEGLVFKPAPKTRAGFRIVELPSTVVTLLKEIRRKQNEIKRFMGDDYYCERDLVFCQDNGRPLDPDGVSRRFHALATEIGFPELRFHDTRHTHVAIMLDSGEDPRIVQIRIGHQKQSTTVDIYGKYINQQKQREAADRFEIYSKPKKTKPEKSGKLWASF